MTATGQGLGFDSPRVEQTLIVRDSDYELIFDRPVTADVVTFNEEHGVIIDWKTGRADPDVCAAQDLQLVCYAVALRNYATTHWIKDIDVVRFHPRLWDENRTSSASFCGDAAYWRKWEDLLKSIRDQSTPDAQAVPGESQCRYCKARVTCPEFAAWSSPTTYLPAELPETLPALRVAELLAFRAQFKAYVKMWERLESIAKGYLTAGVEIPGWTLKDTGEVRSVPDVSAAEKDWVANGLPQAAFQSALSVGIGDLEKAHKAATGLKGKGAREVFEALLGPHITRTPKSPALAPEKGE